MNPTVLSAHADALLNRKKLHEAGVSMHQSLHQFSQIGSIGWIILGLIVVLIVLWARTAPQR
jgi:hypothetical protein